MSTSAEVVLSTTEPKVMIISEILFLIFLPIGIFALCIRETDRIDRNYEQCVNYFRNQHLEEQDEINIISTKGEEL
jgi:hypothetical protein